MVVTRRQSGKLPPPPPHLSMTRNQDRSDTKCTAKRAKSSKEEKTLSNPDISSDISGSEDDSEDDVTHWDSDLTDLDSHSDSGSDYDVKYPPKRAAASKSTQKTAKAKRTSTLSILPTMSLDVLFEIFGHLRPADLLNLSRANKALRRTLMSRKARYVWKCTHQKVLGAPACPDDMSEPRWAQLLFGGTNCQICDAKGVQKINFDLRRRVCSGCMRMNLVYQSKFATKFPDFDPLILDLIPYTNTGGWASGHASQSRFYWKADVLEMAQLFGQHQKAVHMHVPGARKALEDFQESKRDLVKNIMDHAIICRTWSMNVTIQRATELEDRKQRRYTEILDRFKKLGYLTEDVSWVQHEREVNSEKELTDRIWQRIFPILEPQVMKRRDERINRARAHLKSTRMRVARNTYKNFRKTLLPKQWIFLPLDYDILEQEDFRKLIHSDSDMKFVEAHFAEAVEKLPAFIIWWLDEKRHTYRNLLPSPIVESIAAASTTTLAPAADGYVDPLDLATSVFRCQSDFCQQKRLFISQEEIFSHVCTVNHTYGTSLPAPTLVDRAVVFDRRGYDAVVRLTTLIGLHPETALPADLDGLDLRMICMSCPSHGNAGRRAYTWRKAVAHFSEPPSSNHTIPQFVVLSADETVAIKKREGGDGSASNYSWTCNHCWAHLDDWQKLATVTSHVKAAHHTPDALEGRDYFYHPGMERNTKFPIFQVDQQPVGTKTFQCKICPAHHSRRFCEKGIRDHLKAKHQISEPIKGRDWE